MRSHQLQVRVLGFATALAACGPIACDTEPRNDAMSAKAVVGPTTGHDVEGTVHFEALDAGGVRVVADLQGLEPGRHAFHVHEVGDCSEDAAAAGAHFDFLGNQATEGDEAPEDGRITGNLGELPVDEEGETRFEATIGTARLHGERSIVGRSVVVHARGNDPSSPPDGAAGERIACGVIVEATDRGVAGL